MRILSLLLRLACYGGLLFVSSGIVALALANWAGDCPALGTAGIRCETPIYEILAEYGLTVLLVTVSTGIPGLLALGGLFFAGRPVVRRRVGRPRTNSIFESDLPLGADRRTARLRRGRWPLYTLGIIILAGIAAALFERLSQ